MKIINYSLDSNVITGELSKSEKKIIDTEFDKIKPGDKLEIEMLDKKGFIEKKIVKDIVFLCTRGDTGDINRKRFLEELDKIK